MRKPLRKQHHEGGSPYWDHNSAGAGGVRGGSSEENGETQVVG
jgi:hypothetical protein